MSSLLIIHESTSSYDCQLNSYLWIFIWFIREIFPTETLKVFVSVKLTWNCVDKWLTSRITCAWGGTKRKATLFVMIQWMKFCPATFVFCPCRSEVQNYYILYQRSFHNLTIYFVSTYTYNTSLLKNIFVE